MAGMQSQKGSGSSHKKKKNSKTPGMKVNEAMKAWKSGKSTGEAPIFDAGQKKPKVDAKPSVLKAKVAPNSKDRKPREAAGGQLTLKEVLAMGGTKKDFDMLEGMDGSDAAEEDSDGEVLEFDDSGKSKVYLLASFRPDALWSSTFVRDALPTSNSGYNNPLDITSDFRRVFFFS